MTTIANSEASARPSLGRPKDDLEEGETHRLLIHYKRNGTVIKTRLKESMCQALGQTADHIATASGHRFSQTIVVRRALDLYFRKVSKMSQEMLHNEASLLKHQYR